MKTTDKLNELKIKQNLFKEFKTISNINKITYVMPILPIILLYPLLETTITSDVLLFINILAIIFLPFLFTVLNMSNIFLNLLLQLLIKDKYLSLINKIKLLLTNNKNKDLLLNVFEDFNYSYKEYHHLSEDCIYFTKIKDILNKTRYTKLELLFLIKELHKLTQEKHKKIYNNQFILDELLANIDDKYTNTKKLFVSNKNIKNYLVDRCI